MYTFREPLDRFKFFWKTQKEKDFFFIQTKIQ